MKEFARLIFPYGLLLFLLAGASMFFGADTPMTGFMFSGLLLALAGVALIIGRAAKLPMAIVAGLALLALFIIYDIVAGRLALAGPDYAVLIAACAVFVLSEMSARKFSDTSRMWQLMLAVFLLIGLWAFIDFAVNPEFIHGRPRPYHQDRLSAAFLSANTAATFFGVAMLAAAATILRALTKIVSLHPITLIESLFRHATIGVMTFMFAAVCLLLTASRAGLAFSFICLMILCAWDFFARRGRASEVSGMSTKWTIALVVGVVVVLGALFWVISGDVAGARYADLDEDANNRFVMYSAYWEAASEKPLMGHGLGSFSTVNNMIMTADNAHILATQGAAHNIALQWLVQTGWVGTIAMLSVLALIIRTIAQGLAQRRRYKTYLRATLIISLFVLFHGLVDYALEIPGFMWWFVCILGLGAGIAQGSARTVSQAPSGS